MEPNKKYVPMAKEAVGRTTYPGRGILLGSSADGRYAMLAYFIMGRSENSRNRVFVPVGDGIETKAFDESKLTDPSLIIYAPVRVFEDKTVVTNGDQTDTIFEGLQNGLSFEDALRTRTFEPDAPNFTPRISGMVEQRARRYRLSILKAAEGNPTSVRRQFFEVEAPLPGQGHLIHTYESDGNPLPSFKGEPTLVAVEGDLDGFTKEIWDGLNPDNRVSLFTRRIDWETGTFETRIVNKHG